MYYPRLKYGVSLTGMRPELLYGIFTAAAVYSMHGQQLTITSVCDGVHSAGSLHYAGAAFDCRIRDIEGYSRGDYHRLEKVFETLRGALYPLFDVVQEDTHIHVEYQPKKGANQ